MTGVILWGIPTEGIRANYGSTTIFRRNKINKGNLFTSRNLKSSFILRKVFYYGSTESNPEILKTEKWYKNRKHIDSMLIDMTIYYPTDIRTVSISSTIAEKKDLGMVASSRW